MPDTVNQKKGDFVIRRGGSEDTRTKREIRDFVQSILRRAVNISTLIGSGASLNAIPLMGTTLKKILQ